MILSNIMGQISTSEADLFADGCKQHSSLFNAVHQSFAVACSPKHRTATPR